MRLALITHALSAAILVFLSTSHAHGEFVFNVEQVGQSVIATGTGTLNTSALSVLSTGGDAMAGIDPATGVFSAGPVTQTPYTEYLGISGPTALGTGTKQAIATLGSGDTVGVGYGEILGVPAGYVSGSNLSDSNTYFGESISYIGLNDGTYVYTWGSGATADSLTINIGVVPEPASAAAIAVPAALALLRRRRRPSL